jgi:hypothetical protein
LRPATAWRLVPRCRRTTAPAVRQAMHGPARSLPQGDRAQPPPDDGRHGTSRRQRTRQRPPSVALRIALWGTRGAATRRCSADPPASGSGLLANGDGSCRRRRTGSLTGSLSPRRTMTSLSTCWACARDMRAGGCRALQTKARSRPIARQGTRGDAWRTSAALKPAPSTGTSTRSGVARSGASMTSRPRRGRHGSSGARKLQRQLLPS